MIKDLQSFSFGAIYQPQDNEHPDTVININHNTLAKTADISEK